MDWWLTALFALVAGLACGFLLGRKSSSAVRRSRALDHELRQARDELKRYRGQVAEHFSSTAELVNTMTANYRAVYEHLANGAQQLCGDHDLRLRAMEQSRSLPRVEPDGESRDGQSAGSQEADRTTAPGADGEGSSGEGTPGDAAAPESAPESARERLDGWYEDIGREASATDHVKEEREAEKDRVH